MLKNIKKYFHKEMSEINPDYNNDTLENRVGYLILAIEKNQVLKEAVKSNYLINASEIFVQLLAKKEDLLDEVLLCARNHIEDLGYKTNYLELMRKKREVEKSNHKLKIYKGK